MVSIQPFTSHPTRFPKKNTMRSFIITEVSTLRLTIPSAGLTSMIYAGRLKLGQQTAAKKQGKDALIFVLIGP